MDTSRIEAKLQPLRDKLERVLQRFKNDRNWGYQTLGIAIAATFALNVALYWTCGFRGCPDPMRLVAYQPGGASILLDRNGKKFADLAPVQREVIKLSSLPDYVSSAFVAVEDKRFYDHNGVDWIRVGGAAFRNLLSGGIDQGRTRTGTGGSMTTKHTGGPAFPLPVADQECCGRFESGW